MAEAFGQTATQAPQPMQDAASMARSAIPLDIWTALPSGALPVRAEINPPACIMVSRAERSTTRSLITGKDLERNGSMVIVSPSSNFRMCSWQTVVMRSGPWGMPSMVSEHVPQIPSRQSWSKATGTSRRAMSCSFSRSSISRKEESSGTSSIG